MIKIPDAKKCYDENFDSIHIYREGLDEICRLMEEHGSLHFESNNYQFETLDEIQKEFGHTPKNLTLICSKDKKSEYPRILLKVAFYNNVDLETSSFVENRELAFIEIKAVLINNKNIFKEFLIGKAGAIIYFIIYILGLVIVSASDVFQFYTFLGAALSLCLLVFIMQFYYNCFFSLRKKHETFYFRNKEKLLASSIPPVFGAIIGASLAYWFMKN